MGTYTAAEATNFFHSHEVKCNQSEVEEWMKSTVTLSRGNQVTEWDMYAFSDWWRCQGTAYEPGIDDKTKIERLLVEIKGLKRENEELKGEINRLEDQLDILPF